MVLPSEETQNWTQRHVTTHLGGCTTPSALLSGHPAHLPCDGNGGGNVGGTVLRDAHPRSFAEGEKLPGGVAASISYPAALREMFLRDDLTPCRFLGVEGVGVPGGDPGKHQGEVGACSDWTSEGHQPVEAPKPRNKSQGFPGWTSGVPRGGPGVRPSKRTASLGAPAFCSDMPADKLASCNIAVEQHGFVGDAATLQRDESPRDRSTAESCLTSPQPEVRNLPLCRVEASGGFEGPDGTRSSRAEWQQGWALGRGGVRWPWEHASGIPQGCDSAAAEGAPSEHPPPEPPVLLDLGMPLAHHGDANKATLALDCRTGAALVQKCLPRSSLPGDIRQLEHEREVLTQLRGCRHVVQALTAPACDLESLGTSSTPPAHSGFTPLLMEYVPGMSLAMILAFCQGGLPEILVRRYTRGILQGLREVHARGLVHCDVRAGNVLVHCSTGQPKLCGFKYALRAGEAQGKVQRKLRLQGSHHWMAPEVVRQLDQTPASDIWSLGCTVLEMVTGHDPWQGSNCREESRVELRGHARGTPPVPGGISEECASFLDFCLREQARERWSAEQLLAHPFVHEDPASVDPSLAGGASVNSEWVLAHGAGREPETQVCQAARKEGEEGEEEEDKEGEEGPQCLLRSPVALPWRRRHHVLWEHVEESSGKEEVPPLHVSHPAGLSIDIKATELGAAATEFAEVPGCLLRSPVVPRKQAVTVLDSLEYMNATTSVDLSALSPFECEQDLDSEECPSCLLRSPVAFPRQRCSIGTVAHAVTVVKPGLGDPGSQGCRSVQGHRKSTILKSSALASTPLGPLHIESSMECSRPSSAEDARRRVFQSFLIEPQGSLDGKLQMLGKPGASCASSCEVVCLDGLSSVGGSSPVFDASPCSVLPRQRPPSPGQRQNLVQVTCHLTGGPPSLAMEAKSPRLPFDKSSGSSRFSPEEDQRAAHRGSRGVLG